MAFPTNLSFPVSPYPTRSAGLRGRPGLVIITFFTLLLLGSHAFGEEYESRDETSSPSTWEWLKGRRADDALFLDMRSLHLDRTGDFGTKSSNENNALLGIQIYGVDVGTFVNSQRKRSYFGGLSRNVYTKDFSTDTHMDIGYKVGALYGYGKDLPNVGGLCPLILPTATFSYKRVGIEFGLIPVGIFTASFRINLDGILPGSKSRNCNAGDTRSESP